MGNPWDTCSVRRILTNPRYCGEVIFNQTTRRLKAKIVVNPAPLWVHCTSALDPMVSRETFEAAQSVRRLRAEGPAKEDILHELRAILTKHGRITEALCRKHSLLKKEWITKHFGSFLGACGAAALPPRYTSGGALENMSIRFRIAVLITDVAAQAREAGATVQHTGVWNILRINQAITVKITLASNRCFSDGLRRWRVPLSCGARSDFVLCGLLDLANEEVSTYLLLAPTTIGKASLLLSAKKLPRYVGNSFSTLQEVFGLPKA